MMLFKSRCFLLQCEGVVAMDGCSDMVQHSAGVCYLPKNNIIFWVRHGYDPNEYKQHSVHKALPVTGSKAIPKRGRTPQ